LYPTTFVEVLAFQFSVTLCCGGAAPVPLAASTAGVFEASLTKLRFALAVPAAVGLKVAVNEAELPAAIVAGRVIPLTVNSPLVVPIEESVTALLLAVTVPLRL
jgi:hypothetical protein